MCVCGGGGVDTPCSKARSAEQRPLPADNLIYQNKEPEALLSHTFFVNIQCAGSYKLTSITGICIQSVTISCF